MVLSMTLFIANKASETDTISLLKDKLPVLTIATLIPIIAMTLLFTFRVLRDKDKEKHKIYEKLKELKDDKEEPNLKNGA